MNRNSEHSTRISIVGAWNMKGTVLSGGDTGKPVLGIAIFTADGCVATSGNAYTQSAGVWKTVSPSSIQFSLVEPLISGGVWSGSFYYSAAEVSLSGDGLSFSTPAGTPLQALLRGPDGNARTEMTILLEGERIQIGIPSTLPVQMAKV